MMLTIGERQASDLWQPGEEAEDAASACCEDFVCTLFCKSMRSMLISGFARNEQVALRLFWVCVRFRVRLSLTLRNVVAVVILSSFLVSLHETRKVEPGTY